MVIEGRITSSQDLRIDGRVEGTIEIGNHVDGAIVKGKIKTTRRESTVNLAKGIDDR